MVKTGDFPVPIGSEEIVFRGKMFEVVRQKMRVGEKEKDRSAAILLQVIEKKLGRL